MNASNPRHGNPWLQIVVSAFLVGILAYPVSAQAQTPAQDTVSGTVREIETNQPVPGVLVRVAGTPAGVLTDALGRYTLRAAPDAQLVFAHVGYHTVEVGIAGRSRVDVGLRVSAA